MSSNVRFGSQPKGVGKAGDIRCTECLELKSKDEVGVTGDGQGYICEDCRGGTE